MRIAIFHELSPGGARRVVDMYARELSKTHSVDVYYVERQEDKKISEYCTHAHFFPFKEVTWRGGDWKTRVYKDTLELWKLRALHRRIAREIDEKKYDVVFVHPSKFTQAPFVLSYLRTPTVYYCQEPLRSVYDPYVRSLTISSGLRKTYDEIILKLRAAIDSENTKKARLLLANSKFSQRAISDAYKRKSEVCYLGVDEKFFIPKKLLKKYDVLFLGGAVSIEGYDLLKEALKASPIKWNVHVVSRKQNGKGISDRELVKTIQQSRCVVCLSRNEPFGLTVIEVGACGVPVVAVSEGGYKESILDKKTGFLIKRDARGLAATINRLLLSKKQRAEMGKAARAHILSFWTWKQSTARLEKLLSSFSH